MGLARVVSDKSPWAPGVSSASNVLALNCQRLDILTFMGTTMRVPAQEMLMGLLGLSR
jgi:hypothetical protein